MRCGDFVGAEVGGMKMRFARDRRGDIAEGQGGFVQNAEE